jgi:drug/metabolite transporter (DMT)-like permease
MRWVLVAVMAVTSVLAQVNLKVTASQLPVSWEQAMDLGLLRAALLVMRVGATSGASLLLTWYTYKYFGFLELFIASATTYVLAVFVARGFFQEPITWARLGGVVLVTAGVTLFFVK